MNMRSLRVDSLKTETTLSTLAIMLGCMWTLCFYATLTLRKDMERITGQQQLSAVKFAANSINREMDHRMLALKSIAAMVSPALLADTPALQKFLENRPVFGSLFNGGVFVTGADGFATASVPLAAQRRGLNYSDQDGVAAVLTHGRDMVGQPVLGKLSSAPLFAMAVPVRDGQGRVMGALVGVTHLGTPNFLDQIADTSYGHSGAYMVVSGDSRLVVAATDKQRVMQLASTSAQANVLSAAHSVPVANWQVVATLPTAEAFEPIRDQRQRMLLATVLLSVLGCALSWWWLRRQLLPVLATAEQRETALVQSEAFRHSIIESVSTGIAVLDERGIVVAVNTPWRRLARTTSLQPDAAAPTPPTPQDGAVGVHYVEVCKLAAAWGTTAVDIDCEARVRAGIRGVLDGSLPIFNMDYAARDATGTRWFQMVVTPLGMPAPGAVVSHTDITERTVANRALAESEERFALFMNTLPAIAFIKDESGAILFANRHMETLLGHTDWRGKAAAELYPPEVARSMVRVDRQAVAAEYVVSEEEVPAADGTRSLFQVHKFAIARHAKPSLLGCIALDISVQKRAEIALREAKAEAEAANNAKSVFMASASHDLRQPLSALTLYVDVLTRECVPQSRELVSRVAACCTALSGLLTNLLDASKLDAGAVVPEPSNFAVDGFLRGLVTVHFAEASIKGLRLELRPCGALMARTDPALLTRVVGNLIANAVRYTATGGVLVACRQSAGRYWVEVWDTGVGIPADKMETVFEEFTQLATVGPKQGSGLGLAIVAKTAAVLGLKIRMQSRPGRGSMFAVELPTVQAARA